MVKERPILFSAPMVKALLAGSKTQTRRTKGLDYFSQNDPDNWRCVRIQDGVAYFVYGNSPNERAVKCPYGKPADGLWVRETHCPIWPQDPAYNNGKPIEIDYRATPTQRLGDAFGPRKWTPAIHMRREYSRITLELTGVRVERLQDISEDDAIAEGIDSRAYDTAKEAFAKMWGAINAERAPWASNLWTWVLEFSRV